MTWRLTLLGNAYGEDAPEQEEAIKRYAKAFVEELHKRDNDILAWAFIGEHVEEEG